MNNDISEWRQRLTTVCDLSAAWGRQPTNAGADKPMAGSYIEALEAGPFGDTVADFDRLFATTAESVVNSVEPAVSAIRDLLRPSVMTGRDLVAHMHSIAASTRDALAALDALPTEDATVEDLVDRFERDYLLSLAVALTSQGAVAAQVNSWLAKGRKPGYLDVATFRIVDSPGPGRVDMHHVESSTSAGVTTYVIGEGMVEIGPYPQVQSMLYGQWFTYIFAVWEERYRGPLALAHGLAPDGERWRRTDILIPLLGDIRTLRNDFVHNEGEGDESVGNTLLSWGVQDEPLKITVQQMMTLIELFPRAELLATPTRAAASNTIPFPWPVTSQLVEDIRTRAEALKRTRRSRRQIGDEALKLWLDANPEPAS